MVQANAFNALKFAALVKYFGRHRWPLVYRNVGLASQWLTRPGQRLWVKFLLRRVEQVVSVSEASRADFAETFGMSRDRIQITRQGVAITPLEDRQPARARLAALANCPAESPLLVHVGNFAPEKNHAGLLDAFAAIRGCWPAAHLILIGDGPLRQDIDRRISDLGLRDAVHLTGARADAAALVAGGGSAASGEPRRRYPRRGFGSVRQRGPRGRHASRGSARSRSVGRYGFVGAAGRHDRAGRRHLPSAGRHRTPQTHGRGGPRVRPAELQHGIFGG